MTIKKLKFQTPTGMHDILPEDQKYYRRIFEVSQEVADFYGFSRIDTPIAEDTELFSKGIGLSTDIVQKQMFSFTTKGKDAITLRPEVTAPIARAYIQNGMVSQPQPVKLFFFGPVFRYENPQAGRYRQFWQLDLEVLGEQGPVMDVQVIQITTNILREIGLKNVIVEVNSIGDNQCRPYYKKILTSYLRSKESALCPDCRRRIKENPLRVLDCKEEKCQAVKSQAPQTVDHLCEDCHKHFKGVLEFLEETEIPYRLNPRLVRGLDYYTKTVFEIFEEGESQIAIAGGGRYDNLVKIIGGNDAPAVGVAVGIERVVQLMKDREVKLPKSQEPKIYLAQLGDLAKRKTLKLFEDFRRARIPVHESLGRDSLKAQMGRANRTGVEFTLILGQKEALEGTIIIRDMATGRQDTVKLEDVIEEMKERLKKNH
ncbi:MAG: histidine--tRNA ligase [bacterium]